MKQTAVATNSTRRNVAFYNRKITSQFLQMDGVDLLSVSETVTRHGLLRSRLSMMDGIMNILPSISHRLRRNKRNYYPLLKKFEEKMEELRSYVDDFKISDIETVYRHSESDLQFTIMSKIVRYEDFIDRELAYVPPKEEDKIDIQGNSMLSLADRKLI
jgi:hypothetical protein